MKSCIHFIRHGLTEGNTKKWFYGWADVPLLEEGVLALSELKDSGVYPALEDADCYTSGMLRTEQTLEILYGSVPHRIIPQLKEINFGDWECKTFEELKQEEGFDRWINDKTGSITYPGGDSILSFYERVQTGLTEVLGYHRIKELSHRHSGKDAVSIVICHGGVISACMQHMFPKEKGNFYQWIPDPGRGYTVYFQNSDPVSYEKI